MIKHLNYIDSYIERKELGGFRSDPDPVFLQDHGSKSALFRVESGSVFGWNSDPDGSPTGSGALRLSHVKGDEFSTAVILIDTHRCIY